MSVTERTAAEQQEKRHQRALHIIKRWRLMDDEFMKRCFKDNIPAVACILRIIMEKADLEVVSVQIEDTIPNLSGHGIRMDVHATDAAGTEYDIEVQRADKGAGTKRARFNSSLLDLNSLKKGSDYDALPESYVIFITERDIWKHGLPRYHINRMIEELQQRFDDGAHIIYVNGEYQGNDDMGRLMHDFRSAKAEDMELALLKETVSRYKNNPEEVAVMCEELEKWSLEERQEGRMEGHREGLQEGRAEGESRLTTLLKVLKAEGRLQDLERAIEDERAREKLYQEYHME